MAEAIVGKIFKTFEKHGLFEDGVELIGSWCFYLYQKYLGVKSFPLRTQDIDFLIPHPFKGPVKESLIQDLEALGFTKDFKRDGSLYLWNTDLEIQFMTPEKGRGSDKARRFDELGLSALRLRYVTLLLDDPITIKSKNSKINVPNPANFSIHKLSFRRRYC